MTAKRDLKKRIRERQEQTGERYTTARAGVLAQKNLVIELRETTHAGILCPIRVSTALWPRREQVLAQLREILLGPMPGLEPMRRAVLHGDKDRRRGSVVTIVQNVRDFRAALKQGLRGPGPGGRLLSFDSGGHTVIAQLLPRHDDRPILLAMRYGEVTLDSVLDSVEMWLGVRP